MKQLLVAFICWTGLIAAASAAPTEAELTAPIHQFIDSFNKGDMAAAEATHLATGVVIIDEPTPHLWQGPGAFKAWIDALMAHDKALGWTDQKLTLGKVIRADATADRAYVIIEAFYAFKSKGEAMNEDPAFMTYALQKTATGWLINGWTWSGATPHKAK
jgi:hypothetical protein